MIQNTQPAKMGIHQVFRGYRKIYLGHSVFVDRDVFGKAVWVDDVLQPTDLNTDNLYVFASSLQPNTEYTIKAAFFDQMIDSQLLSVQFGISLSDDQVVSTMEEPAVDSYEVTGEEVDVGVSPPVLKLNFTGEAQQIEVQWSPANEQSWTTVYLSDFEDSITVANIPVGTVDVRVRGKVTFPDGQTIEYSKWILLEDIELDWGYTPPSAPENIIFETIKLAEPAERYDVKISWDWTRGSGANSREFVVWRTPLSKYNTDGWDGAEIINTGTGQSFVFINHPYNRAYRYRVSVIAWGPEADNKTYSEEATFIVDADTVISENFAQQTGIELNYAHILGRMLDEGVWRQTFLVDAATGAVAIGIPDEAGRAPINFDPVNAIVNVDGQVITNEIVAASFVLANFTGLDNPKLYSAAKPFYEDPSQGIFIGYDDTDSKFKFDLGDETKFVRWDGEELYISGNVRIVDPDGNNTTDLGSAKVYEATVYKNSTTIPAEIPLSDTKYPPTGWTLQPQPRAEGENTYVALGLVDQATGVLKDGEHWGLAVKWNGDQGTSGLNGDKGPGSIIIKVNSQAEIPSTDSGKNADYQLAVGEAAPDGAIIAYQGVALDFVEYYIKENGSWNDFTVVVDGNQIVNGTLAATKLQADSITGEYISSSTVITAGSGNNVVVIDGQSAAWALYAGSTYAPAAPFRVTRAGKLYATGADISGIFRVDQIIFNDGNVPWEGSGGSANQVQEALDDGTIYPHQDGIQIRSGNYTAGAVGWAIDRYGNAELNNAVVRGTIFATNGNFQNVVIEDSCIIAGATYFTPVRYDRTQSINIPLDSETTVVEFTFKIGQVSNDFALLLSAIIQGGTPINQNPATAVGRVYLNNKLYMSIPVYSGYEACCSGGPEGICYEYCTKQGFDGSLLLERAVIEPDNLINGDNTLKITMYHAGGGSVGTVKSVAEHVYLELARNL